MNVFLGSGLIIIGLVVIIALIWAAIRGRSTDR